MKKIISLVLALTLVFSLAVCVSAAGEGSITIEPAVDGQTYDIYKMASLDSYDTAKKAYLYTPLDEWTNFFKDYPDDFEFDENSHVMQKEKSTLDAAAFAKAALAYAEKNDIDETKSEIASGTTVSFTGLDLGYYVVDSSLGALCGLTTTDPDAKVTEKNGTPTTEKTVEEDSSNQYGTSNDADMFQTVNFKTTITVQAGAENYVLHDKMDAGLTFGSITSVQVDDVDVAAANYTVTSTGLTDGCTFEIVFEDSYVQSLAAGTQIVVSYTASLNENAVMAGLGNVNETWLSYGDDQKTTSDKTTTYTYEFDLVKTDDKGTLLSGAEFKLYDAATGGTEIKVVLESDDSYRLAKSGETGVSIVIPDSGTVKISGLDGNTTYYLEETKAPAGYNKLTARQEVTIGTANLNLNSEALDDNKYDSGDGGVQVVNKTGAVLPETGAMGTMMFITFGVVVMLATAVLLVTKKRMTMIQE